MPRKPRKTEAYEGVSELKLFVPESLRKPMGMILAVVVSHHGDIEPGDCFLKAVGQKKQLQLFFGKDFVTACGNRDFSTRRANKAYLQGLEAVAEDSSANRKDICLRHSHEVIKDISAVCYNNGYLFTGCELFGYRPSLSQGKCLNGAFSASSGIDAGDVRTAGYRKLSPSAQTELITEIGNCRLWPGEYDKDSGSKSCQGTQRHCRNREAPGIYPRHSGGHSSKHCRGKCSGETGRVLMPDDSRRLCLRRC
jgi:hypothetical protein